MYYRNAQAAVVVYDITKAASLDKAKSWVKELQRQANPNIVIALAGNKLDLVTPAGAAPSGQESDSEPSSPHETSTDEEADDATATPGENPTSPAGVESLRQVPKEEAQAYASEAGLLFFETSAKTGHGIMEVFTEIGALNSLGWATSYLGQFPHVVFSQQNKFLSNTFWHLMPGQQAGEGQLAPGQRMHLLV